jgi:DNA-binding NarL/FixJ family response regulator
VRALHRLDADVVLMDIQMPRMNGLAATERILTLSDPPRVLVLTTFDLDAYAFAALRAGASGFLLKDASAHDVVAAIRAVAAGDSVLAPSTTRRMLDYAVPVLPGPATARTSGSPSASARCWPPWPRAAPTPRSARCCSCRSRP